MSQDKIKEIDRKVNIQITAKIDWLHPPRNAEERTLREQADIVFQDTASRLEKVVELMILEVIDMRTR